MRVILYTGKGGVGKTSMAAMSACHMAAQGKKTLVMSTDAAHSLSDSFQVKLGKEPTKIRENLEALEIDTVYESEKAWKNMKDYFRRLLTANGGEGIETEELLVFPGLEELFSMFKILELYESGAYDVIVVDCAPTGETLSLLKYPEQLSGFMEKVLPVKRKGAELAGPVVEKIMKIPMPENSVFDDIEYVMDKMRRLQSLMLNKEVLSVRIVTTPERIVIREAKRNFTCMHLYNYNVDAIFINKIYPATAMEGYFSKWMEKQQEGLTEIKESFSEIPIFQFMLQERELCGIEVLQKAAEELFRGADLAEVLFEKEIYKFRREKDKVYLKIYLPFADKKELELRQNGTEIILAVKNEQRRFPAPTETMDMDIIAAELQGEYLTITFGELPPGQGE